MVRVPADEETVMKCKEEIGNTFNCDGSCTACHAKLVSCHTGVETSIRFGCIPYPKVTAAQNGDPVVKKKIKLKIKTHSSKVLAPSSGFESNYTNTEDSTVAPPFLLWKTTLC